MKIYVVTYSWSNEGDYEDARANQDEFLGVYRTKEQAYNRILNLISEDEDDEIYEITNKKEVSELEFGTRPGVYGNIAYVLNLRHGDGYDLTTFNESFHIVECEID